MLISFCKYHRATDDKLSRPNNNRSTAVPGWPVLETDNDLVTKVATGREVRIAGSSYTLRRVGTEVQTITLAADRSVSTDFWKLSLIHSGIFGETSCLAYDATADDVDKAVESLAAVGTGGVMVTRQGSGIHGDPYIHSVYFEGSTSAGDVNEIVINSAACLAGVNDDLINARAYVSSIQQGGRVERQKLTLATEAGYIRGKYFRLGLNVSSSTGDESDLYASTDCLEWGTTATNIAGALSAIPSVGQLTISPDVLALNTSGMDIFPSSKVPLSSGAFVDGLLKQGDIVYISGSYGGDDTEHVVESISADGMSINFETSYRATDGSGGNEAANVTRVIPESVIVARSGTGKSVSEVQRIVLTATADVQPLEGQGFFRLKWVHGNEEKITECLEFGADPSMVQAALDALGYDLDESGSRFEEGDEGHIIVTREGDASASSGYGYTYTFEFSGVAGISTVVGNVEQLQVGSTHTNCD